MTMWNHCGCVTAVVVIKSTVLGYWDEIKFRKSCCEQHARNNFRSDRKKEHHGFPIFLASSSLISKNEPMMCTFSNSIKIKRSSKVRVTPKWWIFILECLDSGWRINNFRCWSILGHTEQSKSFNFSMITTIIPWLCTHCLSRMINGVEPRNLEFVMKNSKFQTIETIESMNICVRSSTLSVPHSASPFAVRLM